MNKKIAKLFQLRQNLRKQSSLRAIILGFAVLALIPILFFILRNSSSAAAWFNDHWLYRKKVEITNAGSNQTDFQISFTMDTATLITAGKMQADCDDIRVTDINGRLIPHWIEENNPGCNDAATKIWVKAPSIETSGATIYAYYGNPSVSNVEDGDNVFEFFDDFNKSALDSIKWPNTTGSPTINSGVLELQDAGASGLEGIQSNTTVSVNAVFEYRFKTPSSADEVFTGLSNTTIPSSFISDDAIYLYWDSPATQALWFRSRNEGTQGSNSWTLTESNDVWEVHKYVWTAADIKHYRDGTYNTDATITTNIPDEAISPRFETEDQSNITSIDWVFVRKYASTEPSAGSPASEEQSPGPVAYWNFDEGYGTTTNDSTQNGNDGTLGTGDSAPAWQTEDMCISGKCLKFDGSNDYLNVATDKSLHFGNDFTVQGWIKMNQIPQTDQAFPISRGGEYSIVIHMDGDLGYLIHNTSPGWALTTTNHNIPLNEWVHVVLTYDSSYVIKMYANGVEVYSYNGSGDIANDSQTLKIGRRASLASEEPFKGFIDEVKIYPYARSAEEIKADYIKGAGSAGSSSVLGRQDTVFLSEGLVGYWKMDESSWNGTADEVVDSSGNGNHGVGVGTTSPPTTGAGKFGNGGVFDGTEDYINLGQPSTADFGSADFTISAWFKSSNNLIFYDSGSGAAGWAYVWAYYNSATSIFRIDDGSTSSTITTDISSYIDDEWHHLIFQRDDNVIRTYIDGSQHGSDVDCSGVGSVTSGRDIWIGKTDYSRDGGADEYYHNGSLDEVRIYNRALSPKEVSDLYNWAPGPVMHLKMDENTGTTAYDVSGNSSNGTLGVGNSAPSWSVGKFGGGLDFDGTSDYVTVDNNSNFVFGTNDFTVEAWMKYDSQTGTYNTVVSKGQTGNNEWIFYFVTSSSIRFYADAGAIDSGSISGATDGEWHHIAYTRNGDNGYFYLDGVRKVTNTGIDNVNLSTTKKVSIGSSQEGTARFHDGKIDDVRIYNYARTQKQIVEDMNAGHPTGGSPLSSKLLYLKFDEGYGTVANDSGYNGDNGDLIDGPSWSNDGKIGKAVSLDGLNDRVQAFTSDTFEYDDDGDITFSLWFWPDSSDTDAGKIFSKPWNGGGQYNYYLTLNASDTITYYMSGATNWSTATTDTLTTDTWNHLAVSVNGATKEVRIYKDAKLIKTDTHNITDWTPSSGDSNLSLLFGCLYPYGSGWAGNTGYCVKGKIDEVKIYRSLLTDDQVKIDYNQGKVMVMGAVSTESDGSTASFSSSREYCIPGDTTSCSAPVAEWKFDEKTGTTANDTSGGSHTTNTFVGDTSWKSAGQCEKGACVYLDGAGDYVTVPDHSDFDNLTQITAEAWINFSSADGWSGIVSKMRSSPTLDGWDMRIWDNSGTYYLCSRTGNNNNAPQICASGGDSLSTDQWIHVAMTFDGTTGKIFMDGKQVGSGNQTALGANDTLLTIGALSYATGLEINGFIDQVQIYDYARTAAQIAWDYNRGKPVGHWKFDECQGTTAYDSSGFENNGTINIGSTAPQTSAGTCTDGQSTSAWYNGATGKLNSSLNFDGADDYVTVTSVTDDELDIDGPITISAWINPASIHDTNNYIVSRRNPSDAARGYSLYLSNTNDLVKAYIANDGGSCGDWETNTTIPTSTWTHVAMVLDGSNMSFYVNGNFDKQTACTLYPKSENINLIIGNYNNASSVYNFNGKIDDVKIYNYALTAVQIRTLYNDGAVKF